MSFIFVYITNPNKKEAERIALHLIKKRLIACANIFPADSRYWWKGKIVKTRESVLIAKTKKENFEKVKEEVKRMHKYTIPEIARIEVEANREYEDWLMDEVK